MTRTQPIIAVVAAIGIAVVGAQLVGAAGSAAAAIDTDGSRWSDAFGDGRQGPVLPVYAVAKGDRLAASADCTAQDWPNIAPACLASTDGTPARFASRSVTIEYRVGENTSVLVRTPATQVAAR